MDNVKILFNLVKQNKWDEVLDFLKNNDDIDVNIRDNSNNYLINYAIINNNIAAVSLLIHKGSRLDITDNDGRSILYVPIKYNFDKILDLLIHFNKINIGISLIDIKDKNGHIPLHYAIIFKNINAIKILLEAGSDVNISDNNGQNSLHLAVYTKELDIVLLITEQNIHINARTGTGENALHISCNFELLDIAELLLTKGIDKNAQDYEHEFTPLHYSVTLNNKNITALLLKNLADPNIQDSLGNTPLHYTLMEENYEIFMFFMTSNYTKDNININLSNISSKLPIHIFLEKNVNKETVFEFLGLLLKGSNLNYQDENGITAFHYISMNDIWKQFKEDLGTKKLNIFIQNSRKERPVDYINKDNLDEYMDLVTQSYLFVLRNSNFTWRHDWENICSKKLISEKDKDVLSNFIKSPKEGQNMDLCYDIIKNRLYKIYNENSSRCEDVSYPLKINKRCLLIEESTPVEYCSFVGITLDILVGMIYLLQKHPQACSTINTEFIENKDLCNYYKSIGIVTNTKCEFLNFEIVWVYNQLYFSNNFKNGFQMCVKNNKKNFVIFPLGIELRQGSHANYLIYDIRKKEVERFEPYGSQSPYQFDYNPTLLDNLLEYKFKEIDSEINYIKPSHFLPKVGLQYFDIFEANTKKIADPSGFCALWAIWYADMRMTFADIPRDKLIKKILKDTKRQNVSFRNLIRNYSTNITKIRDNILSKASININDWLNDQFTEQQILIIIKEISNLIIKYNK